MTTSSIRFAINNWGIYPALFILREEEDKENYENCIVMRQVIDEVIGLSGSVKSIKVDNDSLADHLSDVMSGLSNRYSFIHNMPIYISQFREHIKKEIKHENTKEV